MKTKIKRHSRSVIAVVLTLCMLVSCMTVGLIATDAAKVTDSDTVAAKVTETEAVGANADSEMVGYTGGRVKGDWDSWTLHDATGNGFTVNLAADRTYKFVFIAGDNNDQFSSGTTISGTTNFNFSRNDTDAIKLKTTVAGNYTFKVTGYDGGGSSMTTRIEFPANTETTTWTAVGAYGTGTNPDAGFFGTAWAPTDTANDMTKSGTTWSKTWNNVTLTTTKTVYYKVAKNHSWDTAYPAQNASQTLAAGTYNITITYNESNNAVNLTATSVAKSTLTVASNSDATVTATYNGTSATNGGTISNIPQGATVTVNVTPATSKMCSGVTYSYSGTTGNAAKTGTSWTFAMPAADTTVNAAITNVTLKKIYFNNSYTLYGSVYAYVYSKDSSDNHTYEYLGPRPGKTMTKLDNSNIWYIEVPGNVDYVEFISGDGKTTGEMKIPWPDSGESQTYTYPKYTAPYNYDAPTIANGGTWGNYIYGSNNKRTNECTVSKGSTMDASNLFTGITATMYDYYTDNEVTNGWLNIANDEYSKGENASGWKWNPYTTLNSALSAYADNSVQPKYDVTTPLYFGNLNTNDIGLTEKAVIEAYHGWKLNANNSINLDPNSTAITGLSGKTLANDTIHYYKSGDANENGAPMAMFDEDFLSGENNANKALATILRTAAFPVRKTTEGATTTYLNKIYVEAKGFDPGSTGELWAHFYGGGTGDNKMTYDSASGYYSCDIPTGATEVIFVRQTISNPSRINWGSEWNESAGCAVPTSTTDANRLYVFKNYSGKCQHNKDQGHFNVNAIASSFGTTTGGHDYYEYDSTDGKDNAYITNLSNDKKTATIDYYADDAVWSGGTANNTKGFFPFDYANKGNGAKDLGFGMKLTIPFTLNGNGTSNGVNTDGTDQEFRFSGDDDLWVFVDGKLVLDLGGAHARTEGSINFHSKTVTANNKQAIASGVDRNGSFEDGFNTNENYVHTMTIYYMERGMFESNLKFGFSFHAIPNQFWIDKKIRTKDIINAGFYQYNEQTGEASNKDQTLTDRLGRFISKFEASYQNESFTVTHKYGDSSTPTTLASGKKYTIDNDTNTYTTPAEGTYPIKHDLGNAFIGQFTTGQYFNLKETYGNNKYVYTPAFSVWDQANNNQAILATGDNSSGYTFRFNPTTNVTTGIENTNIKARFENFMDAHTLTLKKELTNAVDSNATFTLQVLFDFENDNNYIAYPLYCDLDGVRTKLSNTGTIDIKAGQILEIEEIPQKANVQVTEVLDDTVSGYRYAGMTLKKGSTVLTKGSDYTEVTKGIQFQMGDRDMSAVISNKNPDNKYTIVYKYPSYGASPKTRSLYGEQSYTVTGVFTKSELDSYMTLSNGALVFKDANTEKTFINNKAPYEDNFMQNLSFANATLTGNGWDDNGDYSCVATTTSTADYTINAYFELPYQVNDDLIPQESGETGRVAYSDTKRAYGEKDITCFDWYVTGGPTNKSQQTSQGGTPVFVNAPLIVYQNVDNENTKMYFQYWSVKSQSAYGKRSTEYTRCYDYEFNFALFMDSIIEPVYKPSWAQPPATGPKNYMDYDRYNPEIQIQGNDIGINIAFLENSRNQYNNNGGNTRPGAAADVIYSDFLLNFNYNATDGLAQLNKLDANTKMAGLVIEAVNYMDYEVDEGGESTKNFDFDKNYSEVAKFNENENAKKTAIKEWLEGQRSQPEHCVKSEFDVTALDNKNCKQYYYSLNNRKLSSDGQLLNTSQNRYKVFRAYAYIGDVVANQNGLANVKLSDPVYFTIYDVGSQRLPDNATN